MAYGFDNLEWVSSMEILKRVPEEALWRYYLGGDFKLNKIMNARYRVDNSPSFILYNSSDGSKIVCKDFATGFYGDIFDYIQMVYRLDGYSALVKINEDFKLGLKYNSFKHNPNGGTAYKGFRKDSLGPTQTKKDGGTSIKVSLRAYNEKDIEYWKSYGISGSTLLKYKVCAVASANVNYGAFTYRYDPVNPCYAYLFPRNDTISRKEMHMKLYWPFSPDRGRRFMGNTTNLTDIQGYEQCSIKDPVQRTLLVLTKSMKDCMVLHEFGVEAMAIHGETHRFHQDFIRHIRKYYPVIVSLYDRDTGGMKGAKYLWKEYGIEAYFIDKKYKAKDISDLYKIQGRDKVEDFIKKMKKS